MNGLPYYKAYPRDFIEGTIGMPFELKGAYRLVLDLIYMQGGNLPDDARYISGLLGCTIRKWNALRDQLIALGKLQVVGASLTNYRAVIELETLAKLQDKQSENASRPRKNKDLAEPRLNHTEPEPEPEKKERTVANATASAEAPALSAADEIWLELLPDIVALSGRKEAAVRSWIGKMLSKHDHVEARDAMRAAIAAKTGDPFPYVVRILTADPRSRGSPRSNGGGRRNAFMDLALDLHNRGNDDRYGPSDPPGHSEIIPPDRSASGSRGFGRSADFADPEYAERQGRDRFDGGPDRG
jgi:uncharacterized protein YdaU (DUF1376 family)